MNKEQWYSDFITPTISRLQDDETVYMIKLGPLNISKTVRCGYTFFQLGDSQSGPLPERGADRSQEESVLMIPRFVQRYLLLQNSNVKEMLRALRRESLMIIVNYQFGFKKLHRL